MLSSAQVLAGGAAATALFFVLAWAWARTLENYAIVDAVWAFGIGLLSSSWLLSGGFHLKQAVACGLVLIWSCRLAAHLAVRIQQHHPKEDIRYVKLRELWKGKVPSQFFWFFQIQAVSVVLFALPFLMVGRDQGVAWGGWEWIGTAVVLAGVLGESAADAQMNAFKKTNKDSKAVCQKGLWFYSRHPNYFFEGVIWTGFYLFACGSEWGWTMFHAPFLMIFLLVRVTGIPPAEIAAVERKGEAYRRYQRTTNALIPWPPRADV